MGVVNEGAGPRRSETGHKGAPGCDGRHDMAPAPAHARHSVKVALQFDSVPVDCQHFRKPVSHPNTYWLAASQDNRRSRDMHRGRTLLVALLKREAESCILAVAPRLGQGNQLKLSSWNIWARRFCCLGTRQNVDSHDKTRHPLTRVLCYIVRFSLHTNWGTPEATFRRDVRKYVTVKNPIAGPVRHPSERHRTAWQHKFGHRRSPRVL